MYTKVSPTVSAIKDSAGNRAVACKLFDHSAPSRAKKPLDLHIYLILIWKYSVITPNWREISIRCSLFPQILYVYITIKQSNSNFEMNNYLYQLCNISYLSGKISDVVSYQSKTSV